MSQNDVTTNLGQYNNANSIAPTLAELRPQPTLAARVYTLVKEAVISGELAPGSYHTEAAMARVLGVSRAPLREVLRRLQEEGLVEETQRPGFAITSITPKSVLELYETRFALEGFAAAKAAGNIPAGDIDAMRQAQEAAAVPLGKGDPGPFLELEFEFHNLWLRNSGNDLLVRHVDRLRDHVRRVLAVIRPDQLDQARASYAEHMTILDAMPGGDPAELRAAVEAHIQNVSDRMTTHLLNAPPEPALETP